MHRSIAIVMALAAPSTALALPGYWVVDTFNDTPDANLGDFTCADAAGCCAATDHESAAAAMVPNRRRAMTVRMRLSTLNSSRSPSGLPASPQPPAPTA